MASDLLSRITHDPLVMGGQPCIRGMRVTVGTVMDLLASGHSSEEILATYPYLEPEDIEAARAYDAEGHGQLNEDANPLLDEIRAFRDEFAKRHNYDMEAMGRTLREESAQQGRQLVTLPPRPVKK